MNRGTWKRCGSLLFALSLAMAGCQGDKGPQGAPGQTGQQGPPGGPGGPGAPGQDGFFTDIESCGGCHAGSLASKHALAAGDAVQVTLGSFNARGEQTGAPVEVAANGTDLLVRFNVKVNGVNRIDFLQKAAAMRAHNEDAWWYYDPVAKAGIRTKLSTAAPGSAAGTWSFVGNGNGNYTATLYGLATVAHAADPGTAYMLSIMGPDEATATAVAYFPGALQHDAVSSQSCKDCHGNHIWRGAAHDVTSGQGVDACVVCHNRVGAVETRLTNYVPSGATRPPPATAPAASPAVAGTEGTGLMGIVHGVHNSANMVDGTYSWEWPSNGNVTNFKKGFPGNMHNCRTCHQTDAQLAAVAAAPVSWALCISCHDGMNGFPAIAAATGTGLLAQHKGFTVTTSCSAANCHDGGVIRSTVSAFHNGLVTERAGLIWNGEDMQVKLAPTIVMKLTGVKVVGTNLEITWTAEDATGTKYDPCNQDFAVGPVFFGYDGPNTSEGCTNTAAGCDSNMSILRAYAQADDWVNDNVGNPAVTSALSPGQPASSFTLWPAGTTGKTRPALTSCDATTKVATTIVPRDTTGATKGIVSLQGKPQVQGPDASKVIWVRAVTPTREFAVADGALPAAARRQIVDVKKCNACHVGTLYQHGGSRVDSIELCVMCHNPASSEQNNRVGMGVTAEEAYDGKAGETYDLRTMVHAIHAAGETKVPLMYYRGNGIFFFGAKGADGKLLGVKNYPDLAGPECVRCVDEEDGPLVLCPVFGSRNSGDRPEANADGTCKTEGLVASTNGTWRSHRVVEVHYPRALNDCSACHISSDPGLPDPTKAVAVTVDAGAAPWNNLLDDVLVGSATQSCMSCHQNADPALQFGLDVHAFGNSWIPTRFDDGRQTIIDAAKSLP